MAKKIKDIWSLDTLRKKAEDVLKKSKENDKVLDETINNSTPTLGTIAEQLEQETKQAQQEDLQNVMNNNPIDVTANQWGIFQPSYLNTNNLLNKNGILTPTVWDYQVIEPYDATKADITDWKFFFSPFSAATPDSELSQKISDLFDASTREERTNLRTDPDLVLRHMENSWYKYNTTPFSPSEYDKETEGMTLEDKAKYIDQKEKEYKERQERYNQEVQNKIQGMNMEDYAKWDKETYDLANIIKNAEWDPLDDWTFWWGIDAWFTSFTNALWKFIGQSWRQGTQEMLVKSNLQYIWNQELQKNIDKYRWAGWYDKIARIWDVWKDWKWSWGTVASEDEFADRIYEYWRQLEAYKNWEIAGKPNIKFWIWYEYGREIEDEKWERREFSEFKVLSEKDIMDMYEEAKEEYYEEDMADQALDLSISIAKDRLWLQEWEELKIDNWTLKVYKTQNEQLETEKSDVVDNSLTNAAEKVWIFDDPIFQGKNTTEKTIFMTTVSNNIISKADDMFNYRKATDDAIAQINAWMWSFASEEQKQNTLMKLENLKRQQTEVIEKYLTNAAMAEFLYAYYWWDENAIVAKMREIMWYEKDQWWDMGILSDFYMNGIQEPSWTALFSQYDVANRMHNVLTISSEELDDILEQHELIWSGTELWHDVERIIWYGGEAIEWVYWTLWWAFMNITPLDGGKFAAWETQLWVYKKWYQLQWDLGRFVNTLEWKVPEVLAFRWFGTSGWLAKNLGKLTRFGKTAEVWKLNILWRWLQKLVNVIDWWGFEKTIGKIRKLWESSWDIAKAEKMITKAVLRNQTWKTFGNVAKDVIESVYQDAAFFNRWDSEYYTAEQDKRTVYGALFSMANRNLLSSTWWSMKRFWNVAIDNASRVMANVAWAAMNTVLDRWSGSKVIDYLIDTASKWIGRWWIVTWTTVDMASYFTKHPDELAWTMLRSLGTNTEDFMKSVKQWDRWQIKEYAQFLNIAGNSIFAQSQEAARLLNLIKRNDKTWLIALWEKQYVGAMLSSFLQGKTNVNNRELARMINDTWYKVPDMIKRYFNVPWTFIDWWENSRLFLQTDSFKMHQVNYPRELDFATKEWQFIPTKARDEDDLRYAFMELDRQGSWLKDVFNPENIDKYFTRLEDWSYILNKEGLDALWYSNTKLVADVVAQTSEDTAQFVERLREINNANWVEVVSEKLISDIEQTDAYEKLSSQLWTLVCA